MSQAARQRSRWAVPVLVALVGSLLAIPAIPAVGADGEADELATYSACVGPATESAGFRDLDGYSDEAEAAIDCLAHYEITRGTSTGDFDPDSEVTRWQMALFLVRAAGPAGIMVRRPSDQGFEDIGGLAGYIQDAIDQLADLEIAKGTTRSTFSPNSVVTRRQMALFLARFLDRAPVGEGGVNFEDVDPDDEEFTDLRDLPRSAYRAIVTLFEMGVTTGTSRTRFSPDEPVTRAQMALFITRALAHTNARPAGLTLQSSATTVTSEDTLALVISLRDRTHRPVEDGPVDLFYAPSRKLAFNSNGECTSRAQPEAGDEACVIDLDDETTDEDGNLVYELIANEDLVLWAWTGDQDDEFDLDKTEYVSVQVTAVEPATDILVTDDLHPKAIKVPYGRSVTFTFQLVDQYEDPVAQEDVEIRIRIEEERDGRSSRIRTRTYYTDESGEVEFTHSVSDPGSRANDDDTDLTIELLDRSSSYDLGIIDKTAVAVIGDDQRDRKPLPWSSEDDEPFALLLELSPEYHIASERGGRNRVTAMLVDQYGDPISGKEIHFTSDDDKGLWRDPDDPALAKPNHREVTNRRGEATASYFRASDDPLIEMIGAFYAIGKPDGALTEDSDTNPNFEDDDIEAATVGHYWVEEVPDDGDEYLYEVIIHDEDRRTLVLEDDSTPSEFFIVKYDRNDQYNFDGETEEFEPFSKALQEGDSVAVRVRSHNPNRVNRFERL